MRYFWDALGAIVSLSLAATGGGPNVEQLKLRLEMSYEATDEARGLVVDQKYTEASQAYADALNLGRKSALVFQELPEDTEDRSQALQWLVDVFCESCRLNLDHLENVATARADAWAACMFSQYQTMEPLMCMKRVCARDEDWIGELQMCQSLLKLPQEESPQKAEREQISNRLKELDQLLSQK